MQKGESLENIVGEMGQREDLKIQEEEEELLMKREGRHNLRNLDISLKKVKIEPN